MILTKADPVVGLLSVVGNEKFSVKRYSTILLVLKSKKVMVSAAPNEKKQ